MSMLVLQVPLFELAAERCTDCHGDCKTCAAEPRRLWCDNCQRWRPQAWNIEPHEHEWAEIADLNLCRECGLRSLNRSNEG